MAFHMKMIEKLKSTRDSLSPDSPADKFTAINDKRVFQQLEVPLRMGSAAASSSMSLAPYLAQAAQILAELCSLPEDPVAGLGVTFPGSRRIQTKLKSHSM